MGKATQGVGICLSFVSLAYRAHARVQGVSEIKRRSAYTFAGAYLLALCGCLLGRCDGIHTNVDRRAVLRLSDDIAFGVRLL